MRRKSRGRGGTREGRGRGATGDKAPALCCARTQSSIEDSIKDSRHDIRYILRRLAIDCVADAAAATTAAATLREQDETTMHCDCPRNHCERAFMVVASS